MSVTENLMQEHQLILSYCDLMQRYAAFDRANPDSTLLLDNAGMFIDFIREFADAFHHAKEENILFRHLETPGVLTHCNPVPQMLHEHQLARDCVQNMQQALQAGDRQGLADNLQQYAELLRQHIFKEDNILYPMGEQGLSEEQKTAIRKEYEEAETQMDGSAIWKKYTELHGQLTDGLDTAS